MFDPAQAQFKYYRQKESKVNMPIEPYRKFKYEYGYVKGKWANNQVNERNRNRGINNRKGILTGTLLERISNT